MQRWKMENRYWMDKEGKKFRLYGECIETIEHIVEERK